CLQRNKWPYSF
nr:immunoglobulin light chain junction region [Macaca mulatta]